MAILVVAAGGYFVVPRAYATNGVLDHRSIAITTSANGANNVRYTVSFNYGTVGQTVAGLVIDFCTEDPIPNDTCTIPTGFNTNINSGSSYGAALLTAQSGTTGWSIDTSHSTNKTITLTRSPGGFTNPQSLTFGDGSTSGIQNPSTSNVSFYARIFAYSSAAWAQGYTSTNTSAGGGAPTDSGGIALSTTAQLSITAKIEEQLELCLYTAATCSGGVSAQYLGDTNHILSVSHVYSNANAKLEASTNAANGMIIYAQGTTLTSTQNFTIAPIGATAQSSSVGTEQFGFCLAASGGSVTPTTPYNSGSCAGVTTGADSTGSATFAYDVTSSPNMTSLGGMQIASSTGPSLTSTLTLAYMANIAPTTRSGVYSTTQTFIGVGTF